MNVWITLADPDLSPESVDAFTHGESGQTGRAWKATVSDPGAAAVHLVRAQQIVQAGVARGGLRPDRHPCYQFDLAVGRGQQMR